MFKKRLMVVAMTCMLSAASLMCVHAEEPQTEAAAIETTVQAKELKWDDNMQKMFIDNGFAGTVFNVDGLGIKLLVPEGLEERQPTEEEKAKDTKLVFENAEKEQKIELVLGKVSECKSLEEVKAFMEQQFPGVVIHETKINGLDTLVYGSEQSNSMCVLIGAGDAGFLRVICRPVNDPQMSQLYSYVAASIQKI